MEHIMEITEYKCETCNYSTTDSNSWCQHKRTQKHIELNPLKDFRYICKSCNYKTNNSKYWFQHTKTKKHEKNQNIDITEYNYKCEKCCFYTNKKNSHYKHLTSNKHTKNHNEIHEEKVQEDSGAQNIQNAHIINNNIQNAETINNNITINIHGKENLNVLNYETFKQIMKLENDNIGEGFLMLLKHVYIDPEENRNIKYPDTNSKYCYVLTDENKYIKCLKNNIFDEKTEKITEDFPIPEKDQDWNFNKIQLLKDSTETDNRRPLMREYNNKEEYIEDLKFYEKLKSKKKVYKDTRSEFFTLVHNTDV